MEGYFAGMVDNDYFGVLAAFCFFCWCYRTFSKC